MRTPGLIALDLNTERINLGESKQLPFVRVGEWDFGDYGDFYVTPDDLTAIERNFRLDARRTDIPLLNEEHGPGAIGWVSDLIRVGEDRLDAIVELNARGEEALGRDEYRRVSPEILRDYYDNETGESYSMVASGLALTTAPRLKALDRIHASERARVLAFAESPAELVSAGGGHIDGPMRGTSIAYAFPDLKRLPLGNKAQVKGSIARFANVKKAGGTPPSESERTAAWKKIVAAAETFGIDVPADWKKSSLSPAKMAEYLLAEDDPDAEGAEAVDFDEQPCPGCGADHMDVMSMSLRCGGCGTTASFNAPFAFAEISGKERDALGSGDFAVPGKRQLPIQDAAHVRNAVVRFSQTKGLTAEEKAAAKSRIRTAAKKFGVDVSADFAENGATSITGHSSASMAKENEAEGTETGAEGSEVEGGKVQDAANFSELQAMFKASEARAAKQAKDLEAANEKIVKLSETLSRNESATKMATVAERVEGLVKAGKMTPAEAETFTEETHLVKLSEDPWMLDIIEKRTAVLDMGEKGKDGSSGALLDEKNKIAKMAEARRAEAKAAGRTLSVKDSILEIAALDAGFKG